VEQVLNGMVGVIRIADCQRYDPYQTSEASASFVLIKVNRGQTALEAYRAAEHERCRVLAVN